MLDIDTSRIEVAYHGLRRDGSVMRNYAYVSNFGAARSVKRVSLTYRYSRRKSLPPELDRGSPDEKLIEFC